MVYLVQTVNQSAYYNPKVQRKALYCDIFGANCQSDRESRRHYMQNQNFSPNISGNSTEVASLAKIVIVR